MLSDLDLSKLAGGAYATLPASPFVDWRDVRAVVTSAGDGVAVALRGTRITDAADVLRDAEAWPLRSHQHPALGPCHDGILAGAVGVLPLLLPLVGRQPVTLTGHSLGGGLAVIVAGLLTVAGTPPVALVTFEAPRVGGAKLREILSAVPVRQYRFGNDPVPDVPWCPGIYEHAREPLIQIGRPSLDPLSCHSIAGVTAWLAAEPAMIS